MVLEATVLMGACACVFRPLTQEEIAQRREVARQRHAERMMAEQAAPESHKKLPNSAGPASEDPSEGLKNCLEPPKKRENAVL